MRAGDKDEAQSDGNVSDGLLSSSPGSSSLRGRTDSESSGDSGSRFVLPSIDGTEDKILTMDEIAHVFKGIKNMQLAHEIALNPEFKLAPYEPPVNSLERTVKETMHRAFWDLLREDLAKTPPRYDKAIYLLADIKECFPQILSSNSERTLARINEVLDPVVIRQQAEQGVLDFKAYADFVIEIMAKSCAPARDAAVAKLRDVTDVVETFAGILETLTLMKLDMANYLLDTARSSIVVNSVEYERKKFKEYLQYYKFGFPITEKWLKRHVAEHTNFNFNDDQIIVNAFMDIMNWDKDDEVPEVLSMDHLRIIALGKRGRRLCVAASIISVCMGLPIISQRPDNRKNLASQLLILLEDVGTQAELDDAIENIWVQIKTVVNEYLTKEDQKILEEPMEDMICAQVKAAACGDSPVRRLMWNRLQAYFRIILRKKANPPPPPPGYNEFSEEVDSYLTALRRLVLYNHSVFGDYFKDTIATLKQHLAAESDEQCTACATGGAKCECASVHQCQSNGDTSSSERETEPETETGTDTGTETETEFSANTRSWSMPSRNVSSEN